MEVGILIANFIADCARAAGYKGLQYNATKGHGRNVVMFNQSKRKIQSIEAPTIAIFNPNQDADGLSDD